MSITSTILTIYSAAMVSNNLKPNRLYVNCEMLGPWMCPLNHYLSSSYHQRKRLWSVPLIQMIHYNVPLCIYSILCSNSVHIDGGQQLVHHHGELFAYFTTYHLLCNSVFHLSPSHSCRRGLHLKCQINGVQEYISSHFILSHWLVLGTFMEYIACPKIIFLHPDKGFTSSLQKTP